MFQFAPVSPLFAFAQERPVFVSPLFSLPRASQRYPTSVPYSPLTQMLCAAAISRVTRGRPLYAAYAAYSPLEPFAESRPPKFQYAPVSPLYAVAQERPASASPLFSRPRASHS